MYEYPLLFLFPVAMAYAAASDLLTMTIPNRISLGLLAGFLVLAPLAGFSWQSFIHHLGVGGVVLAAGIVLFSFGIFGGGDAKLLAASALWLGTEHLLAFFWYVAVLGGLLSIIVLAYRQLTPAGIPSLPAWAERLRNPKSGVPYGIAIAGAALLIYPKTMWFTAFST